jgi:hypothetical protein
MTKDSKKSGVYIVTLTTSDQISTHANDSRRVGTFVSKENVKFGISKDIDRREISYAKTFGWENFNFQVVVETDRAETIERFVKQKINSKRVRSPKGRRLEWLHGITAKKLEGVIKEVALQVTLEDARYPNADFLFGCESGSISDLLGKDTQLLKSIQRFYDYFLKKRDGKLIPLLSNGQLCRWICAFTIAETYRSRGSASGIPQLLDDLRTRSEGRYLALLDWVIGQNDCRNPSIPFGNRTYGGCKSYAEYKQLEAQRKISAIEGELQAELRRLDKVAKQRIKANNSIWNAIKRKDMTAIETLLAHGVDLESKDAQGVTVEQLLWNIGAG